MRTRCAARPNRTEAPLLNPDLYFPPSENDDEQPQPPQPRRVEREIRPGGCCVYRLPDGWQRESRVSAPFARPRRRADNNRV